MSYKKFTTYWIFIIENFAFVKHIFDKREKLFPKRKNKRQKVKI